MADNNVDESPNNAPVNRPVKSQWPVIGGRAAPEDRYLIDRAALELGIKRGEFVVMASVKEAREVLRRRRESDQDQHAA